MRFNLNKKSNSIELWTHNLQHMILVL